MSMKITITTTDSGAEAYCIEKFLVKSDYPEIEVYSSNKQLAIEWVKGAVLCALGEWQKPPNNILFTVKET